MRWRRAILPVAWTVVACVLLTAGWVVYKVTDPFAGQRQRAVQEQLFQQWRAAPQHAGQPGADAAAGSGTGTGPAAMGIPATATHPGAATGSGGATRPGATAAPEAAHPHPAGTSPARLTRHNLGRDQIHPVTGKPFALIRIPAFGQHWQFAIVEGTALSQLALGPGHVRGTQLPGQQGNFVVAAHDVTAGNPFLHLRTLRNPDRIYVYTRSRVYEYVVHSERVVRYTDTKVESPVPGHPGAAPHRARITLITCTPVTLAFTPWRIVVTGDLARVSTRH
jgi:LPXTG-site transpeptidase (sortase) family protein